MRTLRLITLAALTVAMTQSTQTPAQLLDAVETLLKQLRAGLTTAPAPVVTTAAELTAALQVGGVITVGPGTFTGNFVISKPSVVTGAGRLLTFLQPLDPLTPTLQDPSADDVVVQDLTVQNGAPDRDTVVIGTAEATTAAALPHHVKLQRLRVLAGANGGHRGVALHGTDLTLTDSEVTGFIEKGRDSQAVWICNGPGPFTVTNNILEATGENLLVGGAFCGIVGVNPSDIVIRGNTIRKPPTYRAVPGSVKNLLELKTGVRVLIEGNTFDGNWKDAQAGHAIVFTVRNQGPLCSWCAVDEVTFRGNTVVNAVDGFAVNILGYDDDPKAPVSQQTQRITIDRNLFADNPLGIQVANGVAGLLTITNNTFPKISTVTDSNGKFLSFTSSTGHKVTTPLVFSRNVTRMGNYGITGDGSTGPGLPSLLAMARVTEWNGNLIEASAARTVPLPSGVGNTLVPAGGLAALLNPTTWKLLSGAAGY